jgi:hypothetical protein
MAYTRGNHTIYSDKNKKKLSSVAELDSNYSCHIDVGIKILSNCGKKELEMK